MNTGLVGGITTVPSSRFSKEVDIHTSTPIDVFSEMLRDLQSIHPGLKIDDAGIATTDTSEKYNVYYIIRREQRYGSLARLQFVGVVFDGLKIQVKFDITMKCLRKPL